MADVPSLSAPAASSSSSSSGWVFLTNSNASPCEGKQDVVSWTIQHDETRKERKFLLHVPRSLCPAAEQEGVGNISDGRGPPYPVLLAFHGFTGVPNHEIKKWSDVASALGFVVVAPEGSSKSSGKLGWNGIDCCGDAAADGIDDVGFARGVVDAVAAGLPGLADAGFVVATGFSNGGFMTSLLGLSAPRPHWLRGIIPMAGYQYDTALYGASTNPESGSKSASRPNPLPILAYHGGRDGVVKPGGCCRDESSGPPKSNCPLDIGMKSDSCLPVEETFALWEEINGCDEGGAVTRTTEDGAICTKGNGCGAETALCLWPEAGHTWNNNMPGTTIVSGFLEGIIASPIVEGVEHGQNSENLFLHRRISPLLFVPAVVATALCLRKVNSSSLFGFLYPKKRKLSEEPETHTEETVELVNVRTR